MDDKMKVVNNVKEKLVYPKNFELPEMLEITPNEMQIIWKNIEDCFKLIGFNRWSVSKLLNVRRQTYDRWLRIGTIPDVIVMINISKLLNLPISTILNSSVSCASLFENTTDAYINYLRQELLLHAKTDSMFIQKYWDHKYSFSDKNHTELLIVPSNIFNSKLSETDLFWLNFTNINYCDFDFKKTDIVVFLKELYFYKNDLYLIKKRNNNSDDPEMQIVRLEFESRSEIIKICYNNNMHEEIAISDKNKLLILGRIIKKIT